MGPSGPLAPLLSKLKGALSRALLFVVPTGRRKIFYLFLLHEFVVPDFPFVRQQYLKFGSARLLYV